MPSHATHLIPPEPDMLLTEDIGHPSPMQLDDDRDDTCRALVATSAAASQVMASLTRQYGPTFGSNNVLQLLAELSDGRAHRPSTLAAEIGLTTGGMSKLISRLEAMDVVRRADAAAFDDQRAVGIELTAAGDVCYRSVASTVRRGLATAAAEHPALVARATTAGRGATTRTTDTDIAARFARLGTALGDTLSELPGGGDHHDIAADLALAAIEDAGGCRPRQLVDVLGLTSGGVSRLLDRLEHAGAVTRTSDPSLPDGRAVIVALTESGRRRLGRALDAIAPIVDEIATVATLAGAAGRDGDR